MVLISLKLNTKFIVTRIQPGLQATCNFIAILHKREIVDDRMKLPDILRKDPVFARKTDKTPHIIMRRLQDRAASQRPPEFDGLTGTHQLDRQDILEIIQHLVDLSSADAAHADMVFLSQGGRDTVRAGWETQRLVFRYQSRRRILGDHEPAVEPDIVHQ